MLTKSHSYMESYFTREKYKSVIVEEIELLRATLNEAESLKKILMKDIVEGYLNFVVDFKQCTFIDSTFLSTLVTTLKHLHGKGGDLRLSSVGSEIRSLLELTGTAKIFQIFDNKKEAIQSYS
jgi:anti-sigma B factor antagonist